jgi:hypothetical protein
MQDTDAGVSKTKDLHQLPDNPLFHSQQNHCIFDAHGLVFDLKHTPAYRPYSKARYRMVAG